MFADPATPGSLIVSTNSVSVPAPIWTFVPPPPTPPTAPSVLVAEIAAPDPPEVQGQYGNATWVRVFKTELDREVALEIDDDRRHRVTLLSDVTRGRRRGHGVVKDGYRSRLSGNLPACKSRFDPWAGLWQYPFRESPLRAALDTQAASAA